MVMANKGETEKGKIEAIALQFLSSSHSTPAPQMQKSVSLIPPTSGHRDQSSYVQN